jgi:hypothetical protein
MSKLSRLLCDALGTVIGAFVGTYWLLASSAQQNPDRLKFWLSITGLGITYVIVILKVATAILEHQNEIRRRRKA